MVLVPVFKRYGFLTAITVNQLKLMEASRLSFPTGPVLKILRSFLFTESADLAQRERRRSEDF